MEQLQLEHRDIDKSLISINQGDILKLLGELQMGVDAYASDLVEEYIGQCLHISSPKGAFVLAEALESSSAREILIPDLSFESGKIIHKMLRHSESYAFFLVTAGPAPENLARSLMSEGNYLEGYIADLVTSTLVDSVADQIHEQVRNLANKRGLLTTNRYSPGYCSWNVEEQQKLFRLFPEGCCDISLSESSLMDPIKSISGIIGIGAKVEYSDYTCEICPMLNCHFRKVGAQ